MGIWPPTRPLPIGLEFVRLASKYTRLEALDTGYRIPKCAIPDKNNDPIGNSALIVDTHNIIHKSTHCQQSCDFDVSTPVYRTLTKRSKYCIGALTPVESYSHFFTLILFYEWGFNGYLNSGLFFQICNGHYHQQRFKPKLVGVGSDKPIDNTTHTHITKTIHTHKQKCTWRTPTPTPPTSILNPLRYINSFYSLRPTIDHLLLYVPLRQILVY